MERDIIIETTREGYGLDEVSSTLTVAELIGILEEFDSSSKVYLSFDRGYTFGGIGYGDFREEEAVDEDEDEDEE